MTQIVSFKVNWKLFKVTKLYFPLHHNMLNEIAEKSEIFCLLFISNKKYKALIKFRAEIASQLELNEKISCA